MSQPMQQQPTMPETPWDLKTPEGKLSHALESVGFKSKGVYAIVATIDPFAPNAELSAVAFWQTASGVSVIQCVNNEESRLFWPIAAPDLASQLASIVDRMGPSLADLPIWQAGDTSADRDTMLDPETKRMGHEPPANYKTGKYRPGE